MYLDIYIYIHVIYSYIVQQKSIKNLRILFNYCHFLWCYLYKNKLCIFFFYVFFIRFQILCGKHKKGIDFLLFFFWHIWKDNMVCVCVCSAVCSYFVFVYVHTAFPNYFYMPKVCVIKIPSVLYILTYKGLANIKVILLHTYTYIYVRLQELQQKNMYVGMQVKIYIKLR